jgi:MinD-like ATPase involved in chromosome partitioning or flagellar assembly
VTTEPEVALVFSPEGWVEGLHRHLTDHGGARVRQVVMEPSLALEEEYGTLIVSHRWPALTRPFVEAVHARRRRLLGVFDPAEPAGREHLLTLGIDRVIESDAPMTDFLDALVSLAPAQSDDAIALLERRGADGPAAPGADGEGLPPRVAVGGPPGGGATEVAIELARAGGCNRRRMVLIDADDVLPSVAQRLALTIEPNLRTAVDAVEYGMGDLTASLADAPDASFEVLCGLPNVAAWSQVRPGEVLDVLDAVGEARDAVVVDVSNRLEDVGVGIGRSRYGITRAVVGSATVLVAVGSGTPVGVTRLLGWIAEARSLSDAPVHVVINRAPADGFRRAEIADEIERTFPPTALWFVPHDDHIEAAAWTGSLVATGPFARAVAAIAAHVLPARSLAHRTRTRRHRSGLLNGRADSR